jgi:hypothetical protein
VTGQAIGWWQFDDERTTLTSTLTGQSVRYIAAAVPEGCRTFTNSGNRRWLRFEYQDRYTHYPLLIEWRNVPLCGRPLVWRVDHERSAQLWRYMTNADVPHPAYGLWRRVDDCVIDAFACWPSNSSVGHYPTCVALNAGWTNGAWTTRFYRAAWANRGYLPVALDQDSPLIASLDAPAPAPWLHIVPGGDIDGDRQGLQPSAPEPALLTRNLERLVHTLPHLMSADHVRFLIGLPRREGFDSQVHTIRRLTKRAYFSPTTKSLQTFSSPTSVGRAGVSPLLGLFAALKTDRRSDYAGVRTDCRSSQSGRGIGFLSTRNRRIGPLCASHNR